MNHFIDASILVEACLAESRHFTAADVLVKRDGAVTSAHASAEAYATLSGDARLKIKANDAAQMVTDLAHMLQANALGAKTYIELIRDSPDKGITGGSFFDAIHAQAARESNCVKIHTLNARHFKHVAPDLSVRGF
jgi:predicted nucleic acid-binding protein